MMRIDSLTVINYGDPSGNLCVSDDGVETRIKLSQEDSQQVLYLAERLYEQYQMRLAEQFRQPLPALVDHSETFDV